MREHKTIDEDIKRGMSKRKSVKKVFLIIDMIVSLLIPTTYGCFLFIVPSEYQGGYEQKYQIAMTYLYPAIFGSSVALIMTVSAAKLARSVRKLTNKKPNVCLINWHIFNLLLLTFISIITVILMLKLENW